MKTKRNLWVATTITFACVALLFVGLFCWSLLNKEKDVTQPVAAYGDEMKMPRTYDYNDDGATKYEREGDHQNTPYFYNLDFYNMESTDTLTILPNFETYQQTSWWSCGPVSLMMVYNHYDKLGDWTEKSLSDLRSDHSQLHDGSCLDQMIEILDGSGEWEIESTYDYLDNLDAIDLPFIQSKLKEGSPIVVGWNDWNGHWATIIGYDEMDTPDFRDDDVLIMADSFDTTDHNQDGYGVYGADRFINNFTFFDFFGDDTHQREKCFIVLKPAK